MTGDYKMTDLSKIKCFLLDMDGTVTIGNELLPGAAEFLKYLKESGRDYLFMTNNSSKNSDDYVQKMRGLGIACNPIDVMTSGEATVNYLYSLKPKARVYLMGTPELEKQFLDYKFILTDKNPDFVVLGFDKTLTYEKLVIGCDLIRAGVPYIATHPDFNCPMPNDAYIPDCGAMMELIKASTGKTPKVIGKPNREIVESVFRKRCQYKPEEFAMVGDRLYTDVKTGINAGITSILVLSGEATMKDVNESDVKPTYIFKGVGEIYEYLKEKDGIDVSCVVNS